MDQLLLGLLALVSFYIGYVYLFRHDLAHRWDASRRKVLNQTDVIRNATWEARARRRGISAIVVGVLLLAIAAGIL